MLSRMPERAGMELGGTYRLTRLLGEGGMGEVWEAQHVRLPKRFAVKFLHAEALRDKDVFTRFRREAEIASGIGNAHIVDVVDFNHDAEGVPYMVLEYLDGEDLSARLQHRGKLSVEEAVAIAEQVASALDAAHAKGVVHRDLKPQNIFLVRFEERDDFVKVLDFGISKVLDSGTVMTKTGAIFGTPNYMSPEQVDGLIAQIDGRTDVFALGAILYEMLAGRPAFDAPTISAVFNQVCHKEPEPIGTVRSDVPEPVASVITRAMSKQRDARFASMAELRTTLLGPSAARTRAAASLAPATVRAAPRTTMRESTGQLPTLAPRGKRRGVVIAAAAAVAAIGAVAAVLALRGQAPAPGPTVAVAPSGPAPAAVPPSPPTTPPPAVGPPPPAVAPTGPAEESGETKKHHHKAGTVAPTGPAAPTGPPAVTPTGPPSPPVAPKPDAGVPHPPAAPDLRARFMEAGVALRRGDHAGVIRIGKEILAARPGDIRALRLIGASACASKDAATAKWVFERASGPVRQTLVSACARQGITLP
jgi:eukaryotic-like serine/threonine-protein kinase